MTSISKCEVGIIKFTDYGRIVWAKLGLEHHWPALIIHRSECNLPAANGVGTTWVFWFGDNRVSKAPVSKMKDFLLNFSKFYIKSRNKNFKPGIRDCIRECCHRIQDVGVNTKNFDQLLDFAQKFHNDDRINMQCLLPSSDYQHSLHTKKCLARLYRVRGQDRNTLDSDCFPTSSSSSDTDSDSEERKLWRGKASLLKEVKRGNVDIETLCIACSRTDLPVVAQHPIFYGGLCIYCRDEAYDSLLVDMDTDVNVFCCVCASPGEILLCDSPQCSKVFCVGCVELLVGPRAVEKIQETDPWWCFLCTGYQSDTHNLIKPRPNWKENIKTCPVVEALQEELFDDGIPAPPSLPEEKPLRVLSLFDGISTGLLALDHVGITVSSYYSSEIDVDAINVSKVNFNDRITYLGDVQNLTDDQVLELCPIDLLIGGSPCNDLSFVNPNRRGLFDCEGTGILFFHFFRIQKILQCGNLATQTHLFWLFENVAAMARSYKNYISKFLQCNPVVIDAKHFSPQCRLRCFWGNIHGMANPPPLNCNLNLQDCLTKECDRIALVSKINCVTTNPNSLLMKGIKPKPVEMKGEADIPWITELEKIFGFPQHYTDIGNLTPRQRQVLLGRSWSVPVIRHLLAPMKPNYLYNKFQTRSLSPPVSEDSFEDAEIIPEFSFFKSIIDSKQKINDQSPINTYFDYI